MKSEHFRSVVGEAWAVWAAGIGTLLGHWPNMSEMVTSVPAVVQQCPLR